MSTPNTHLHTWAKQALIDLEGTRAQAEYEDDTTTLTKFETVKSALEDLRDETAEA